MNKKRLIDIDIAIGISIILVVFGHLLLDRSLPEWYIKSRELIYKFHMPLFMFFSGFLMAISYKPISNRVDYMRFIKKKASKFIPAYLFFSILFLVLETLRYGFTYNQLKIDLLDIIFSPSKAPAGFLWYIYILFQYYLILPLIMWLVNKNWVYVLALGILFQFFKFNSILNLDLFSFYLLFIILGILAFKFLDLYYKLITKFGWLFLLVFVGLLISNVFVITKLILGLISIPAIHYLAIQIEKIKISDKLAKIGRYSYYIYLMNTLVMGVLYVVFITYFKLELSLFVLLALFLCGIFCPIFIYNYIIKKIPFLNKIIQ